MNEPRLNISEVRIWANTLLDVIEHAAGPDIEIVKENYWSVFPEDSFEMLDQPEILVGSVFDDIADLKQELLAFNSQDRGMVVWHASHHFLGVFNYLAVSFGTIVANAADLAKGGKNA